MTDSRGAQSPRGALGCRAQTSKTDKMQTRRMHGKDSRTPPGLSHPWPWPWPWPCSCPFDMRSVASGVSQPKDQSQREKKILCVTEVHVGPPQCDFLNSLAVAGDGHGRTVCIPSRVRNQPWRIPAPSGRIAVSLPLTHRFPRLSFCSFAILSSTPCKQRHFVRP